jgi:hypothetical protein
MQKCFRQMALHDHECRGRITWEHSLQYGGHQLDEVFSIIGLCAYSHGVDQFQNENIYDRRVSEWIAVNRMTLDDEAKYPKRDWKQLRKHLNTVYGKMVLKS